ncbi:hypothetical protein [Vibrio alginolyticus]|uniref:hypothetical protein n=1 Tax=Vibrio alginolyticus TaxID=663 RepID=UPI00211A4A5E|nr:hypothetical protein [Vibrio alginolyticus]MCQ9070332.1 asparagine synthase [Vibrio alginolyticus]
MSNFLLSINEKIKHYDFNHCLASSIDNDIQISKDRKSKFYKDSILIDNEAILLFIDGVVLNKSELSDRYDGELSWENVVINLYKDFGDDFFSLFRGSFQGVILSKENDKTIIFSDHIGSKPIYYTKTKKGFIAGSCFVDVLANLKELEYTVDLEKDSAYDLLTYGFVFGGKTLVKTINRIEPGRFVKITPSELSIEQFYKPDNKHITSLNEEEIIDRLDELFRQAIHRAFSKDREHNYKHLVALSGGLDSRMTTWVANQMGFGKNIVNYTFSESDYLDETIPKKIARDLKHEWIFKSLDNGLFLNNVDEITKITGGNALYFGLSHGKSCLDLINQERFGMIHSGQLGDVVIGTYSSKPTHVVDFDRLSGAYSRVLANNINLNQPRYEYPNEEMFKLNTRGFSGINQGLVLAQQETETYSPFYDVDLLNFCLSIPLEMRFDHYIYRKWLQKKYPQSGDYVWEKTGSKINTQYISIKGRSLPLKYVIKKLLKKVNFFPNLIERSNMNPIDFWLENNKDLRDFYHQYFKSHISFLDDHHTLKSEVSNLFDNGTSLERNQVISLLSIAKIIYEK